MRGLIALVAALATVSVAANANAQEADPDPAEFTPQGYTFCGWKELETGEWKMLWDDSLGGAFLIAYAQGMTCRDARRNVSRVGDSGPPLYRATRPGYRCVQLRKAQEYSDVRCVKQGSGIRFRFQTGA